MYVWGSVLGRFVLYKYYYYIYYTHFKKIREKLSNVTFHNYFGQSPAT